MPETVRPDGARIHYEVYGTGFPVLLLGPGEVPGQCDGARAAFAELATALAAQFRVVTVDARHQGRSTGPAEPFCYGRTAADQLAVLDELGIERAHVVASGAGTPRPGAWSRTPRSGSPPSSPTHPSASTGATPSATSWAPSTRPCGWPAPRASRA